MNWVLLITVFFADGHMYMAEFPMASEEECRNEIEWPGNAPYEVMSMGVDFDVDCIPNLKKGEFLL